MGNPQPALAGYRTADMNFAAYLKVAAVPFVDTDRVTEEGRGKIFFVFEDMGSTVMRDMKRQFFSGKAEGSYLEYAQAIKWAKMLTHME